MYTWIHITEKLLLSHMGWMNSPSFSKLSETTIRGVGLGIWRCFLSSSYSHQSSPSTHVLQFENDVALWNTENESSSTNHRHKRAKTRVCFIMFLISQNGNGFIFNGIDVLEWLVKIHSENGLFERCYCCILKRPRVKLGYSMLPYAYVYRYDETLTFASNRDCETVGGSRVRSIGSTAPSVLVTYSTSGSTLLDYTMYFSLSFIQVRCFRLDMPLRGKQGQRPRLIIWYK